MANKWKTLRTIESLAIPGLPGVRAELLIGGPDGETPGLRIYYPGQKEPITFFSQKPLGATLVGHPEWSVYADKIILYKDPWLKVTGILTRKKEVPAGKPGCVTLFTRIDQRDGAMVAPYDDNKDEFIMIEEPRIAVEEIQTLFPSGYVGDVAKGETPYQAAIKELREEAGYEAREMHLLGVVHKDPGASTQRLHSYLAIGVVEGKQEGEEGEGTIKVVRMSRGKVLEKIVSGEIRDIQTSNTFFLAERKLESLGLIS